MAHMMFEWVKRRQASFGSTVGETLVIGEPIDVGDWEELVAQIDSLATTGSPGSSDILADIETSLSLDEHAKWESCQGGGSVVDPTIDAGTVLKISAGSSNGLRKWARLVLIHNSATSGQAITIHCAGLLKKRTPA